MLYIVAALFAVTLIYASVTDFLYLKVTNTCWVVIIILTLLSWLIWPDFSIEKHLIGFCIISVPMAVLCMFRPGAFGGADIKMMAVCGLFLGTKTILYATVFGILFAGVACVWIIIRKKVLIVQIPFIPFLSAGIFAGILFTPTY